jgi:hypothetical protein
MNLRIDVFCLMECLIHDLLHRNFDKGNAMGTYSRARTAWSSGAIEFYRGVRVTQSLITCRSLLSLILVHFVTLVLS